MKKVIKISHVLSVQATLILGVILFIFFTIYNSYKNEIIQNINATIDKNTAHIEQNLLDTFNRFQKIGTSLQYNDLVKTLSENDLQGYAKFQASKSFSNTLLGWQHIYPEIYDIALISNNSRICFNDSSNMLNQIEIPASTDKSIGTNLDVVLTEEYRGIGKKYYCYSVFPIYSSDYQNFGDVISNAVFIFDMTSLNDMCKTYKTTENTEINIMNSECLVIMSSNEENIGKVMEPAEESEEYIVKKCVIGEYDWNILYKIPKSEVFQHLNAVKFTASIIAIIGILIFFLLSILVRLSIALPIKNISKQLIWVGQGQLKERLSPTHIYELQIVTESINRLLDDVEKLTKESIEQKSKLYLSEISKKQADIMFLRNQINPHFLYNTLEIVRSLAVIHNVREIEDIVVALATLFRYSVKGGNEVSAEEELAMTKEYLSIQKYRFPTKFEVIYHYDEACKTLMVPKLCLQPLVENSIVHGFRSINFGGKIEITIKKDNNKIYFRVKDNGAGIEQEKMKIINDKMNMQEINYMDMLSHGDCIGVLNLQFRLKLMYPDASFSIFSNPDAGTEVTFSYSPHKND